MCNRRDNHSENRTPNPHETQATNTLPTPPFTAPNSKPSTPNAQQRIDFLHSYGFTEAMLRKIKEDLVDIARAAGQMMIDTDPSVDESVTKKNSSDRVTATDKAIEKMVQDRLKSAYPRFGFLGEETFKHGDKLGFKPTFVCDPIDGTLNFIHGFPNTAVSLGLTILKTPFVGVVYNPFRGDLFTAIKWQGAFLTTATGVTRRLPISPVSKPMSSLNDCLIAVEWGSQRDGPNWEVRTSMAQQLMTSKAAGGAMAHSVRSNGSAALDFCYVAAGWIDVFWEGGCWIWDVCAGWIILQEAGGIVASANAGDWQPTLEGRLYLAVRGAKRAEQEGVVMELWGMMGERKFVF
jgi:myo-inositol-1(or 4)-monophosphatase